MSYKSQYLATDRPFENDKFIEKEMIKLRDEFNISTVVETGTFWGQSAKFFGKNFEKVYTFELHEENSKTAQDFCKGLDNMEFFIGDSMEYLPNIIDKIKDERTLFFLDSHLVGHYTPTPFELDVISNMNNKPIICIHDFHVPNSKLVYDKYEDFQYKFENIEKYLDDIYDGEYEHYYNSDEESAGAKVGVIYIKPKNKI